MGFYGEGFKDITTILRPILAELTIPAPPTVSVAIAEDHSGGGHTASKALTIPSPPTLALEVALIDQYYDTGDDGDFSVEGANWEAQTFTTNQAHNVETIIIKGRKFGSPGTVTVGVRATAAGLPTGADLVSATFDGDAISTSDGWITIAITLQALSATTKYAIVVRATGGDASNYFIWRKDGTTPTYTGGARCYSVDSGANWTEDTQTDFMFREGEVI